MTNRKIKPVSEDKHKTLDESIEGKRPVSVTINRSMNQVLTILKDPNNFPLFLENLEKVKTSESGKVKWHFGNMKDKASISMALVYNSADKELVWKSEDNRECSYSILINLEKSQAERSTIVRSMICYNPVSGKISTALKKIFGTDLKLLTKKNLQRFKAFCETGHIPTTDGQSSGRAKDLIKSKH